MENLSMMRRSPMKPGTAPQKRSATQCVNQLLSLFEKGANTCIAGWKASAASAQNLNSRIYPGTRVFASLQFGLGNSRVSRWVVDFACDVVASDGDIPAMVGLLNGMRHARPFEVVVNIITQVESISDSFLLLNWRVML
jgi:hypothetical protein